MLAATALSLALALAPQAPPSFKNCKGESTASPQTVRSSKSLPGAASLRAKTRDKAFADAARLLRDECTAVDDGARYVQARCEGDVVELLLRDDVAAFRVAALQKGITPPWCIEKGCINGSMNQRKTDPQTRRAARLVSDRFDELAGRGPLDAHLFQHRRGGRGTKALGGHVYSCVRGIC